MQNHVKVYFEHFGYDQSDVIMCEFPECWSPGVDIHHIESRSKYGSKRKDEQDSIGNLICLCRSHHERAHGPECREVKAILKEVVAKRK